MVEYIKSLYDLYVPEKAEGQGLVEYALILVLISVVAIAAMVLLGDEISAVFTDVTGTLSDRP
ncbi:MAG: hypothetical protein DIU58_016815 [Sphaerobacter thermophilus]|uniref:Flp family type IVb pilin n=1 Tax=Sphaerobacter thermophilus TaxID=2057 RepID=UPI00396EF171